MKTYLQNLTSEKNLNLDFTFEVEGANWGVNFIPLNVVIENILIASKQEQSEIKDTLVKIDFHNGDVMHFFAHLAVALAK